MSVYPYALRPILQEAGLSPISRMYEQFCELQAGEHNNLWYAIGREGSAFAANHADVAGALALRLYDTGLTAATHLADALSGLDDTSAISHVSSLQKAPDYGYTRTCSDAEFGFARVNAPPDPIHDFGGFILLMDDDKEPVLLEKQNFGVSCAALSLTGIVCDGVTYPAGFIFGVVHDRMIAVGRGDLASGRGVLTAPLSDVLHLQPRRASIYSVPQLERRLVFADLMDMHGNSENNVCNGYDTKNWEISDIAAAATPLHMTDRIGQIAIGRLRTWKLPPDIAVME